MIRLILANAELQKADLEKFFHALVDAGKICETAKK